MKAILKFDLNDPEDRIQHKIKMSASEMHVALFRITRNMKKEIRWEIEQRPELQENGFMVLDRVFERINEICEPAEHILGL